MSKYLPLATFLRRQKSETVVLTFAEIERIVSGLLPKASADPAWWQADATSSQPQQRMLAEAGYSYLGELERGRRNPTLLVVEKVAKVLDTEPLRLLR